MTTSRLLQLRQEITYLEKTIRQASETLKRFREFRGGLFDERRVTVPTGADVKELIQELRDLARKLTGSADTIENLVRRTLLVQLDCAAAALHRYLTLLQQRLQEEEPSLPGLASVAKCIHGAAEDVLHDAEALFVQPEPDNDKEDPQT